jgi:DNA ligase-1
MNLIVTHDIQLASKWEGTLNEEVAVSLKLDGLRCSFIIENGKVIAKTRQNKTINKMYDLTKAIMDVFGNDNLFVDGELLAINDENLSSEDLFKKTSAIVNSKDEKKDLTFVAFDIVPLEDYYKKKNEIPFYKRRETLEKYIENGNNELVLLAPLYFVTKDSDEVNKKLNEVVTDGMEGLILNKLNGFYEFKRTKQLLKVKKFNEADVLVTDILEGDGRLEGTLGKIEVQFKYEGNIYTNNVGSGFNDEERRYFWEHKDELIGKIVTISYFEITSNDNGGYGFRFPTWKGKEYIRFDKKGIDDTNV